jgi:hypothetical protein
MSENIELLPCPLCSGRACIERTGCQKDIGARVRCVECSFSVHSWTGGSERQQQLAVAIRWNRRIRGEAELWPCGPEMHDERIGAGFEARLDELAKLEETR